MEILFFTPSAVTCEMDTSLTSHHLTSHHITCTAPADLDGDGEHNTTINHGHGHGEMKEQRPSILRELIAHAVPIGLLQRCQW